MACFCLALSKSACNRCLVSVTRWAECEHSPHGAKLPPEEHYTVRYRPPRRLCFICCSKRTSQKNQCLAYKRPVLRQICLQTVSCACLLCCDRLPQYLIGILLFRCTIFICVGLRADFNLFVSFLFFSAELRNSPITISRTVVPYPSVTRIFCSVRYVDAAIYICQAKLLRLWQGFSIC